MSRLYRASTAVVLAFSVVALAGMADISAAQTETAGVTTSSLNDGTVAGIFDALNQWDIDMGGMVADQGRRKDIRAFAAQLVRDHHAIQALDQGVVKKLKLQLVLPKDLAIQKSHDAAMKNMKGLKGNDFDRAFLQHEVAFHKAAIALITDTLLHAVQSAELKDLIVKSAPAFQAHLIRAENLLGEN